VVASAATTDAVLSVFPIGLSNGPPANGLARVAAAGVNLIRTGRGDWNPAQVAAQIAAEKAAFDTLHAHGLRAWLWLGELTNLPAQAGSDRERALSRVADGLQGHPALAAYKGEDEPRNPFRGANWIRPPGLVRGYRRLKQIDSEHPLVIIQAPIGAPAQLRPYGPAFDITGADIYPVSYPPGTHAQTANRDISVVGDITKKMVAVADGKPVWMTLQIVWSGVIPSQQSPGHVPRFPSLPSERFMAYQAIVNGASGLVFFGGHLTEISPPDDAAAGWNWTFWEQVLRPVVAELASPELAPALAAPAANVPVRTSASGIELTVRRAGGFLYLIAVRRSGGVGRVKFIGLPAAATDGVALFEYEQRPLPPPIVADHQVFRRVGVSDRSFSDWFALHDAHVYRFPLPG
jgi:hypothetical protein